MGMEGVVVIDKGDLDENDGSSSHAPGGMRIVTPSKFFTVLGTRSRAVYDSLPLAVPGEEQFFRTGSMQTANTPQRLESYDRIQEMGMTFGVDTFLLSPEEVADKNPLMDPSAIVGGIFLPDGGVVKTSRLATAMRQVAEGTGRARFHGDTAVTEVIVENGSVRGVKTSNPELGEIRAPQVLLCTNIWAPLIADQLGINMPLFPGEHQYIYTEPTDAFTDSVTEATTPVTTIDDIAIYFRQHHDRIGIGSYHHQARLVDPAKLPKTAKLPFTPEDFSDAWELMHRHVPATRDVKVSHGFNGMFSFTVDGMPIMGESPVKGFWTSVGAWLSYASEVGRVMARWMTTGDPGMDVEAANISRFHDHQMNHTFLSRQSKYFYEIGFDVLHPNQVASSVRNIRFSPYKAQLDLLGANYVPFAGYESPWFYESNSDLVERYDEHIPRRDEHIPRREGYEATAWSPIIGAEQLQMRENVALVEWSAGIGPVEISGPGSLEYLQHLCTAEMDRPVGSVIYTLVLTPHGTIKRDVTVARLDNDRFWLLTGKSNLPLELDYYRSFAPDDGSVTIVDESQAFSAMALWGPKSRHVLAAVTDANVSDDAFLWYSARQIGVGMAPAVVLRLSYVGELGYEIYVPTSFGSHVWDTLWEAGRSLDMRPAGSASVLASRFEKGYMLTGAELTPEITPAMAGMNWLLAKDKDFVGSHAAKAASPEKRLVTIVFDDRHALMYGWEPVLSGDDVVGWITGGNYGYSVGSFIAMAYVDVAHATKGTRLRVRYTGQFYEGTVTKSPVWDPENARLKA